MNSWFTVKVKYTKQLENGSLKRVNEPYLLAAMTFTDAEARIYEELGSFIRGEFMVTGISRTDLQDIFQYDDSDQWFKCKITYGVDEEDGERQKKISQHFLVSAPDVKTAYLRMEESLSTLMIDFQVLSIAASPIVEIFSYRDDEVAPPRKMQPQEEEPSPSPVKGVVFSDTVSDVEDLEDLLEAEGESALEDSFEDTDE
ncbi:MAG: DUF4494 domain-containing protein [Flavobacteriales bacterium]